MSNHCDSHSAFPFLSFSISLPISGHSSFPLFRFLTVLLLPHSPSVPYTFYPLFLTPFSPPLLLIPTFFICGLLEEWLSSFGSLFGFSCVGFMVWCCGWLFFSFYGLFYPIHPVSSTLSLTPLLNFLFKPNLSGRGLVKVMRNSTYKVGWEEW